MSFAVACRNHPSAASFVAFVVSFSCVYAGALISGPIRIGDCAIVAAGAIVTRDVLAKTIVYGTNIVKPLERHHVDYLRHVLHHCNVGYVKIPGLMYKDGGMHINADYAKKRATLLERIRTDDFARLIDELF
ncbi:MAG TPA: hypothetical protein VN812_22380 [Candidatus Acidoferrales bacterium]|nr:hypothetical protein [Candidatus Acidoferrales bacterium]